MSAITIVGVHCDVSDRARQHIETKLCDLNRYHPAVENAHVTVREIEKGRHRADVVIRLPQHHEIVAHAEADVLYAAVDGVHDKVVAQLRKLHDKETKHRSDRHRAINV